VPIQLAGASLALASLGLTLWQWAAALRFPLRRRVANPDFAPPVTLLKPLKGANAETAACLESWLAQSYAGPVQILFAVDSPDDPAAGVVRALLAAHPGRDAALVLCPDERGANGKVSKLIQLWPRVKHDVVVISDADVRVPPDLLANVVAPLQQESVGLVTCLYRLANPVTAAMCWEAIAINADFWSQVLQARSLGVRNFALGAVMAAPRRSIEAIGGFGVLADHLADDYQLGHRIAASRRRIELCPVVVDCHEAPQSWGDVWHRQLRWARTLRACRPASYFLSILGHTTLWAFLCALGWIAAGPGRSGAVVGVAIAGLAVRVACALHLQVRFTRSRICLRSAWLLPVKDVLQVALWGLAFTGSTIVWRGERYRIARDGTLVRA
jgi:ceramide glucosyltransferase